MRGRGRGRVLAQDRGSRIRDRRAAATGVHPGDAARVARRVARSREPFPAAGTGTCGGQGSHRSRAKRRLSVKRFARACVRLAQAFVSAPCARPDWDRRHPEVSPQDRRRDGTRPSIEQAGAMKLIWKFNLVLLGIFLLGFAIAGYVSYRVLQANAREEIVQNARLMMEAALVVAHVHEHAGQAAARDAAQVRVPAADGARVRGDRGVQRDAQEASRLRLQGGDAQPDQSARPRERLGGRHRQRVPPVAGQRRR